MAAPADDQSVRKLRRQPRNMAQIAGFRHRVRVEEAQDLAVGGGRTEVARGGGAEPRSGCRTTPQRNDVDETSGGTGEPSSATTTSIRCEG